jgi:hypothetical protein
MTTSTYGIFEYITLDIIHLNQKSCRGYKYSALFVDKCSTKKFAYYLKRKSYLVTAFKKLLRDYHHQRLPRCFEMRILHTDIDSLVLDKHFNDVLVEKNIRLHTSLINISRTLLSAMSVALRTAFVLSWHTTTLQFVTGVMPWTTSAIPLTINLPRISQ